MRLGGTSAPRRNVGFGGWAIRWAQSRGEWPGSRRTFLEGREGGDRVDVEGAREDVGGAREREGGPRRVDAAEGGGRRAVEGFGGARAVGLLGSGLEGGGMSELGAGAAFRFTFGLGRAGGGID